MPAARIRRRRPAFAGLVAVSGTAPWPGNCGEAAGRSTVTLNSEVEPSIAVDPLDGNHLIGAWQQDRWANGGAKGVVSATSFDGGHTWTTSVAAFTLCSGGIYQRATDPWVSIGPDGTAWQIAYSFDASTPTRRCWSAARWTAAAPGRRPRR